MVIDDDWSAGGGLVDQSVCRLVALVGWKTCVGYQRLDDASCNRSNPGRIQHPIFDFGAVSEMDSAGAMVIFWQFHLLTKEGFWLDTKN